MIGGMTREWREWKDKIDKHYGSIDDFPNARTIRIMRDFIVKDLALEDKTREQISVDPNLHTSYVRDTADEYQELKAALAELDAWLAKRGLKP